MVPGVEVVTDVSQRDWFVWRTEGRAAPNNWRASVREPRLELDPAPAGYYYHYFYLEQPDLNWRNPEVREAMADVVRHWVGRGADGFRVDAVDRLVKDAALRDDPPTDVPFPLPMPEELHGLDLINSRDSPEIGIALATLREAAGEVPLIGEVYLPIDRVAPYLEYFDSVFGFDLLHAEWDAEQLAAAIDRSSAAGGVAWVTSNHDFPRVATRWGEENARAAAVLLLTLGSSAFVYQGEEIGMVDGPEGDPPLDRYGRDGCRRPMQWDGSPSGGFTTGRPWLEPVDPERRNVDDQAATEESILRLFRELIAVRRRIEGVPVRVEAPAGMLAFDRGSHRVVVNLGDGEGTVTVPGGGELPARRRGRPRRGRARDRSALGRDPASSLSSTCQSVPGVYPSAGGGRRPARAAAERPPGERRQGADLGRGHLQSSATATGNRDAARRLLAAPSPSPPAEATTPAARPSSASSYSTSRAASSRRSRTAARSRRTASTRSRSSTCRARPTSSASSSSAVSVRRTARSTSWVWTSSDR